VTTSLRGNLDVIRSRGEVFIGKQKVKDLNDESERYVANLKLCCVVLQGGKLGADQFLKCKNDIAQHETRMSQIVTAIGEAEAAQTQGKTDVTKQKVEAVDRLVGEVREQSAGFMQKVAQLRPAPADPTSDRAGGPTSIGGSEQESNNDIFHPNSIRPGSTITAEISPANDQDWFVFHSDAKVRDWVDIKIANRSTTLRPCVAFFDSSRNQVGGNECAANATANTELSAVIEPGKDYYISVTSAYAQSEGAYTMSVTARKAYDAYEPNDDVFSAKPIPVGKTIDANIMYNGDVDWYLVKAFPGKQLIVRLENRSTTLSPCLSVSDNNRNQLGDTACAQNASANLELTRTVEPGKDYYIWVGSAYSQTAGDYRLTPIVGSQ
jgi:hypothetical protein